MSRRVKLSRSEQVIEQALIRGEYADVGKSEFDAIAEAVAHRRKDAVLNIRVNSADLKGGYFLKPTTDQSIRIPGLSDPPQPAVAEHANQVLQALAEGLQVALAAE